MDNLINLHIHQRPSGEETGLINHPVQEEFLPEPGRFYSAGIHPWHLDAQMNESWLSELERLIRHPQVLAIGECGIDRSTGIPLDQQEPVFIRQAELAEEHPKPLILHAVRSYSDLLRIRKARRFKTEWVLHGFTGNDETTKQLLKQGFFFSFGAALLKDKAALNESLRLVPLSQLFFETDEQAVPVKTIYNFASSVLGISVEKLKETVGENFERIFRPWETGRNEQP
ncbi:MAG: TatD family hydrolase [Mangrovibacterium sp.]